MTSYGAHLSENPNTQRIADFETYDALLGNVSAEDFLYDIFVSCHHARVPSRVLNTMTLPLTLFITTVKRQW